MREAKAEGIYPLDNLKKIKGEIEDFYKDAIAPIESEMKECLVYSASSKMLENCISVPRGHRFEIDWVLFLSSMMLFIEVSAGKRHKQKAVSITY